MRNGRRVLSVENLRVHFPVKKGLLKKTVGHIKAVDGVSFDLWEGKTLGLVGESGCGKTTVAKAIVRLIGESRGRIVCRNRNLLELNGRELRRMRSHIQMIFQDPFSSLDPKKTVGDIIGEPIKFHRPKENAERLVKTYMQLTGLREEFYKRYPHEFSGGQRQRIGIARALAPQPEIIVADEPVSALDVSVQAKVLNLMKDLQRRLKLSYLFITHDLSVVKHISDQIVVMYLGRIVERFDANAIGKEVVHPYTKALIACVPVSEPRKRAKRQVLEGEIPSPLNVPKGCCFVTRCPYEIRRCHEEAPAEEKVREGHSVACHRWKTIGRAETR